MISAGNSSLLTSFLFEFHTLVTVRRAKAGGAFQVTSYHCPREGILLPSPNSLFPTTSPKLSRFYFFHLRIRFKKSYYLVSTESLEFWSGLVQPGAFLSVLTHQDPELFSMSALNSRTSHKMGIIFMSHVRVPVTSIALDPN